MKKLLLRKLIFIGIIAIFPAWILGGTDVYIGLEARGTHLNLGLSKFLPKNLLVSESKLSRAVESVVRYDLLFSLYFNLVEGGPIPDNRGVIDFESWKKIGADALITGQCELIESMLVVTVQLFDVQSGEIIWTETFEDKARYIRRIAHKISDEVVLRFTGEQGIAQTRIAFSNDTTGKKEIYVVDYDGHNLKRLTNDKSIALFPRWSPDGNKICYTTYKDKNPDLFVMNADGTGVRPLSVRQGLNTAARWSPDGQYIALTLSLGKDPNIYLISPQGQLVRQLTFGRGAEISPDFSPPGNHIVYTSDRPGYPQLYIIDINGRRRKRLFNGQYCDSPAWSPRGDRIAFTMLTGGKYFDIYVIDIFGRRPKRLTFNSRNNENPAWSPDGRFIVFTSKRNWKNELFIMSVDGTNQHRVVDLKGECFTPIWSPYLK